MAEKGLVIALGKPKGEGEMPEPEGEGPDEYDALASEMMRAFKSDDSAALASVLRESGMFGPMGMDDDF